MTRISIYIALAMGCFSFGHLIGDKNSLWRPNDFLLTNIEEYYKTLAITTEDASNTRKRFVSVFSLALMYFAASTKSDELERAREAVAKVKKQLGKTADAIAGPTRAFIILIRVVLDKHMNDIKASCTPDTEESECKSKLQFQVRRNKAKCIHYNRNLALYNQCKDFATSSEYADIIKDLGKISNNPDVVALSYFSNIVLVAYPDAPRRWRDIYQSLTNTTYPCNAGNLPFF